MFGLSFNTNPKCKQKRKLSKIAWFKGLNPNTDDGRLDSTDSRNVRRVGMSGPITSSVWSVSVEATPRRAAPRGQREDTQQRRGLLRGSQQSELLYRVRLAESDFSPGNCESYTTVSTETLYTSENEIMLTDESLPFHLYRIAQDATTYNPTYKLRSGHSSFSRVDASPSHRIPEFIWIFTKVQCKRTTQF